MHTQKQTMKRLFILTIKFTPVIMMIGILGNNLLYYFGIGGNWVNLFDIFFGNSLITTFLLYICSYTFGLCSWHRLLITANLINVLIAGIDRVHRLPISDVQLLLSYYMVASIFLLIILYNKFFRNNEKHSKSIG